ncbi:ABC transporter permease [Noviherbaspirillum galbum]|uniref:ABC transporter permease subunit n=1 Tax=Noviherbaspirillum galbum TaxID=2709383 RepID=A0A6B3SLN6_9BURK|nr:ABC transporter permease subunit [Noviherbaspirillum galbum]NEX59556.1 ABC transporter permease subunit [Noviherbaspirillum galbum]
MLFYGYGSQLLQGLKVTLALSLSALAVAFLVGMLAAAARVSPSRTLRGLATAYVTLVRGVPDLVTMLLMFYGLQILLNDATEALGWSQITIDPFTAGVLTLGFIYGAYFAETFRGAFLAVPRGPLEAGLAFGMTRTQVFRRLLFPQMMRFALPGIGNNWQVLMKSTALVSVIGLNDLVRIADQAGKASYQFFFFIAVTGAAYLAITTASLLLLQWLERRYAVGVRMAQL